MQITVTDVTVVTGTVFSGFQVEISDDGVTMQ